MKKFFFLGLLAVSLLSASSFAAKMEDVFTVESINGGTAVLSGEVQDTKAGDFLYFIRSPFRFKILSVSKNSVTIDLSPTNDVAVGNTMLRSATKSIETSIKTEETLNNGFSD